MGKKQVKMKVKEFLKGNQKVLIIPYDNEQLNPTREYHSLFIANPFSFIWKLIIIGITTILPASGFKNFLLRLTGMRIGKGVSISAGAIFDLGYLKLISIGDGVIIGTGVKILTHESTLKQIRIGRVDIGKKSLIGVRSVIRSGISIGEYSVVGMGSVVINDVPNHMFVGGVPAKQLKSI